MQTYYLRNLLYMHVHVPILLTVHSIVSSSSSLSCVSLSQLFLKRQTIHTRKCMCVHMNNELDIMNNELYEYEYLNE